MAKTEDTLSDTYQYAWSKDSNLPLADFLKKVRVNAPQIHPRNVLFTCAVISFQYKPSMVQNDGTKPVSDTLEICSHNRIPIGVLLQWIWVRGSTPPTESPEKQEAAVEEATKLRMYTFHKFV
jgi:hypothetical protein